MSEKTTIVTAWASVTLGCILIAALLTPGTSVKPSCLDTLADLDRVAKIATVTQTYPGQVSNHDKEGKVIPLGTRFAVTENPCVEKI